MKAHVNPSLQLGPITPPVSARLLSNTLLKEETFEVLEVITPPYREEWPKF